MRGPQAFMRYFLEPRFGIASELPTIRKLFGSVGAESRSSEPRFLKFKRVESTEIAQQDGIAANFSMREQ